MAADEYGVGAHAFAALRDVSCYKILSPTRDLDLPSLDAVRSVQVAYWNSRREGAPWRKSNYR